MLKKYLVAAVSLIALMGISVPSSSQGWVIQHSEQYFAGGPEEDDSCTWVTQHYFAYPPAPGTGFSSILSALFWWAEDGVPCTGEATRLTLRTVTMGPNWYGTMNHSWSGSVWTLANYNYPKPVGANGIIFHFEAVSAIYVGNPPQVTADDWISEIIEHPVP